MEELTARQTEILRLVRQLTEVSGYPPTRAEIAARMGFRSVRDAGILEGDLLAVHRTQDARSGQIVVARLADEVTVKRLRRRGHAVQLLPENPEFEPIEVDLRRDPLTIEGIAVGVIRNDKNM